MTLADPPHFQGWLRLAGILEADAALEALRRLGQLELPAGFGDSLAEAAAPLLQPLGDSLGCFRALSAYAAASLARGQAERDLLPLPGRPESLTRLLQAFDLGSEPQRWLIGGSAELAPPLNDAGLRAAVRAITESDASRSARFAALQRLQRSETIAAAMDCFYGDLAIEETLRRLSTLAEQIVDGVLRREHASLVAKYGEPTRGEGEAAGTAVLAAGSLGGRELSYDEPLTLLLVTDAEARTRSLRPIAAAQFAERLGYNLQAALTGEADSAAAPLAAGESFPRANAAGFYQVHWWRNSRHSAESIAHDRQGLQRYFESKGRTWQRLAMIRLRPLAGDAAAGAAFVDSLRTWLYRRYLGEADITGVAVLKRKLLRQLSGRDLLRWDAANPHQGVQLIDQTARLLQLSFGHCEESLRGVGTAQAIAAAHETGHLSADHAQPLLANFRELLRLDLAMRLDPAPSKEGRYHHHRRAAANCFDAVKPHLFETLQSREGFSSAAAATATTTAGGDSSTRTAAWAAADQADLVLDPSPPRVWVAHVLRDYRFSDPQAVYELLQEMGEEEIAILSTRRCRLQLAKIVPTLLSAASQTPSPVVTLQNLNRVTKSLGGKRVLWQLFADSPAAMKAMVRMAAASPYLTGLLTQSPGMIDELIDSLLLGRLPSTAEVRETLDKWVAGQSVADAAAEFKRSFQLRIAVRDVLSKSDPPDTARALSDVADAIAACAAENSDGSAAEGEPGRGVPGRSESGTGDAPPLALLAIGRWGDRGIGYRSPLTMLLTYDDAALPHEPGPRREARARVDTVGRRVLRVLQQQFAAERMFAATLQWNHMEESDQLSLPLSELRRTLADPAEDVAAKLLLASARPIVRDAALADTVRETLTVLGAPENCRAFAAYVDSLAAADGTEQTQLRLTQELAFAVRHSHHFAGERRDQVEGLLDREETTRAVAAMQRIDLTLQLAGRTAADRLPREVDERARVVYLLGVAGWDEVIAQLRGIRATLQAVWREIADAKLILRD